MLKLRRKISDNHLIIMNKILKKHSIGRTVVVVFFAALAGFTSCSEDIDNSNLYTFTGETINDFLQKDSTRFSNFSYILHRVKLDKLLSAYGTYTCFAPTNDADRPDRILRLFKTERFGKVGIEARRLSVTIPNPAKRNRHKSGNDAKPGILIIKMRFT